MAFDVKYIIELIDKFTPSAKKISESTQAMTRHMEKVTSKIDKASASFRKFGRIISTHLSLPLGVAAAAAIHTTAKFERSMSKVKIAAHTTSTEFKMLKDQAIKLGASNVISSTQIAESEAQLASFGLKAKDISQAIMPIMQSAIAAQKDGFIDMSSATRIGIRLIRGYHLKLSELPNILDTIAVTTHQSGLTLNQYAEAMKYVDTTMSALGAPFVDTNAIIIMLGLSMIEAQMAGRGWRNSLNKLLAPTGQLKKTLGMIHVDFGKNKKDFVGTRNLLKEMFENFRAFQFLGPIAGQVFTALKREGLPTFDKFVKMGKDTTFMQTAYQEQTENLAGSIDKLNNSIQALSISLTESQLGPLKGMINKMQGFIVNALGMSDSTKGIIAATIGFLSVIGPTVYSLGIFLAALKYLGLTIGAVTVFVGDLAVTFAALWVSFLAPVIIIAAGLALATIAIVKFLNMFKWGRKIVKYLSDDFNFFIAHPIQSVINGFKAIGHAFSWLYTLIHGKPLKIDAGVTGGITSYGGVGTIGQQSVYSSLDVNVFDPKGYIKSVSGKSQADDFNVALGANMAYSR